MLLRQADDYYLSGAAGLGALSWRTALAVDAARRIYSAIGTVLAQRRYDVLAGRAFVPRWRKWVLALGAVARAIVAAPARLLRPFQPALPGAVIRNAHDVIRL